MILNLLPIATFHLSTFLMHYRALWWRLEQRLAQSRIGRLILNLTAIVRRPHKATFFARGIRREFTEFFSRKPRR